MNTDREQVVRYVQRGCTHREVRALLLHALRHPGNAAVRAIVRGTSVVLYGPDRQGRPLVVHMTISDRNAHQVLAQKMRRVGIEVAR